MTKVTFPVAPLCRSLYQQSGVPLTAGILEGMFFHANTEILERNCKLYGDEVALVELNPEVPDDRRTWKDYELIQPTASSCYRREITWNVFNEKGKPFCQYAALPRHRQG